MPELPTVQDQLAEVRQHLKTAKAQHAQHVDSVKVFEAVLRELQARETELLKQVPKPVAAKPAAA